MVVDVIDGGFLSSIQDLGRSGYARFGVPRSGAMDEFAFRCANRLVGNPDTAAGIEIGPGGMKIRITCTTIAAVCGAGYTLSLDDEPRPLWTSFIVRSGQMIELKPDGNGVWAELAIFGGIQVASVMDSRSTYLRGGFGGQQGRTLISGDSLPIGDPRTDWRGWIARWLPPAARPRYSQTVLVQVVEGPQRVYFSARTRDLFFRQAYTVHPSSDRIGYRLVGAGLVQERPDEVLSAGMLPGTIQVPADQQPVVMLADCPTSGGYPRIAAVIRADLGLLAQCVPGSGQVRFKPVDLDQAQRQYLEMFERLGRIDGLDEAEMDTRWAGAMR